MIDKKPALIARCRGVSDVIHAVRFAHERELLVAVRGGGHNVAGFATCNGGIVIDLSAMKAVRVESEKRVTRAEGGATCADLDRETQVFGLAAPGGVVSTTGIAGLTLGGGQGWLRRTSPRRCTGLCPRFPRFPKPTMARTSSSWPRPTRAPPRPVNDFFNRCESWMSDEVVRTIDEYSTRRQSPKSMTVVWALGGAMSRLGAEETAIGNREAPYLLDLTVSNRMDLERLPLIVTDGFVFYEKVVRRVFGPAALYGQVLKTRRNDSWTSFWRPE